MPAHQTIIVQINKFKNPLYLRVDIELLFDLVDHGEVLLVEVKLNLILFQFLVSVDIPYL